MTRIVGNYEDNNLPSDGDDNVYGRGGNDTMNNGGTTGDRMIGDAGNDSLNGGAGNDWLVGGFDGFEGLKHPLPDNATHDQAATWVAETLAPLREHFINSMSRTESGWNELVANTTESVATGRPPDEQTNWRDRLPPSPETSRTAGEGWTDKTNDTVLRHYHPGADQDLRFYGGKADTTHFPTAGQQATYYKGKLITDGPGAGTPDLVSPEAGILEEIPYNPVTKDHHEVDVAPYDFLTEAEQQGITDQPAWLLYHDLGWTPKNPPGAEEYWGFDGNDTLNGGKGADTYVFGVGGANDLGFHVSSGQDTIQDAGAPNESDRILVYGAELNPKPNIQDYFKFTATKTDLHVAFNFGEDYEEGSVIIKNMNDPAHQVERLDLVRDDYVLSLDLVQKFNDQQVIAMGDNKQVPSTPAPLPPASDTVQDLGGDKPSGDGTTGNEKIAFSDLPPPPDVPPPPPPSFSPGSAPEPDARSEAPSPGTVQDLGGDTPTVPHMDLGSPHVDDVLIA